MTIKNYTAFAFALIFGLTAAAGAQAQLLDTSSSVRIETGTSLGSDTGTGVSTGLLATTSADALSDTDGSATSSTRATVQGNGALGFSFDRKGIDDGTAYSVDDASGVQTSAGLESYAASSVRDDERLESVGLADGMLSVRYKTDAKLFGFIPGSMNVMAAVDADGAVTVRYPWYAFLMASEESRAELEARLTNEQASIRDEIAEAGIAASAGGEASVEARQWALMLERLRSSLYANSSAEARR